MLRTRRSHQPKMIVVLVCLVALLSACGADTPTPPGGDGAHYHDLDQSVRCGGVDYTYRLIFIVDAELTASGPWFAIETPPCN